MLWELLARLAQMAVSRAEQLALAEYLLPAAAYAASVAATCQALLAPLKPADSLVAQLPVYRLRPQQLKSRGCALLILTRQHAGCWLT